GGKEDRACSENADREYGTESRCNTALLAGALRQLPVRILVSRDKFDIHGYWFQLWPGRPEPRDLDRQRTVKVSFSDQTGGTLHFHGGIPASRDALRNIPSSFQWKISPPVQIPSM